MTTSVLSYWKDYFHPGATAPLSNHSTGLIAANLHRLLSAFGDVVYVDNAEEPRGLQADLFVGHFWSFAQMCERNEFRRTVAVYVLSNPTVARTLLGEASARHRLPMPDWDLPPQSFDDEATLERADLVLLCGNSHTLATFPRRWRSKIRLFNYALDDAVWAIDAQTRERADLVYVATNCGLRKGFLDVIETWRSITPETARLHVVGRLSPPYDALLAEANTGSVVVHGWIDSASPEYRSLLRSRRFAYIPTWVEGQMGTVLEAVFAGCIPITTAACGIDDELLSLCVVVDAMRPQQHRAMIEDALLWSAEKCLERSAALQDVARRRHNWALFDHEVAGALAQLLAEPR